MSNYDWYDRPPPTPEQIEHGKWITDNQQKLKDYFDGINGSCFFCGATVTWHWTSARAARLHIEWHERTAVAFDRLRILV